MQRPMQPQQQPPPQQHASDHYWHINLDFPPQPSITYEQAASHLVRAHQLSTSVMYAPRVIDKPVDGEVHIVFQPPNTNQFPSDGVRYLEGENRFAVNVGGHELEIMETKYGFIPGGIETTASRLRRKFRLLSGANPAIFLIHYMRGPATQVPPQAMNMGVRQYPIQPSPEQPIYIAGERAFNKLQASHPPPPHLAHGHGHQHPGMIPGMAGMGNMGGMGMGGGMGGHPGVLAQNHAMVQMERERAERERLERGRMKERERGEMMAHRQMRPMELEEPDEEHISARALARARFKRNHEILAEIFSTTSIAQLELPKAAESESAEGSASVEEEMEAKIAKLNEEIRILEEAAEARRVKARAAEQHEDGVVGTVEDGSGGSGAVEDDGMRGVAVL